MMMMMLMGKLLTSSAGCLSESLFTLYNFIITKVGKKIINWIWKNRNPNFKAEKKRKIVLLTRNMSDL